MPIDSQSSAVEQLQTPIRQAMVRPMAIEALLLDLGNVVLSLDFRRMLDAVGLPIPGSEKTAALPPLPGSSSLNPKAN